jgi:hypothetical protein
MVSCGAEENQHPARFSTMPQCPRDHARGCYQHCHSHCAAYVRIVGPGCLRAVGARYGGCLQAALLVGAAPRNRRAAQGLAAHRPLHGKPCCIHAMRHNRCSWVILFT